MTIDKKLKGEDQMKRLEQIWREGMLPTIVGLLIIGVIVMCVWGCCILAEIIPQKIALGIVGTFIVFYVSWLFGVRVLK